MERDTLVVGLFFSAGRFKSLRIMTIVGVAPLGMAERPRETPGYETCPARTDNRLTAIPVVNRNRNHLNPQVQTNCDHLLNHNINGTMVT